MGHRARLFTWRVRTDSGVLGAGKKLGSELGGPERGTSKLSGFFGAVASIVGGWTAEVSEGRSENLRLFFPRDDHGSEQARSSTIPRLVPVSQAPHVDRSARLGVLGGTFDPIHVGHLVTAVNVRHALSLDRVILMVANVPWQKEGQRSITPAADRLAMVEAAVSGVDGLEVGRLEIDRGGPSYTADTLQELASRHADTRLFTIVGDDAAAGIHSWERVDEVLELSTMVVVDRPGVRVALPGDIEWVRVEVPHLDVSSTDLRARFADGRPLDYLITEPVLEVIRARGLYAEAAKAESRITTSERV
ncbi:MAG: nicotinate-nucleotide adenylyltransferase [Actinomycetota bacterium]